MEAWARPLFRARKSAMGKRKIEIVKIAEDRKRLATFHKRKPGLLHKAMELSILCDVEVAVIIFGEVGGARACARRARARPTGHLSGRALI